MIPAATPDPSHRSFPRTIAGAVASGSLAFVGTALAGQLVGFAAWLAGARAYGARLPLKLGWLYLVSFHRVGIRLTTAQPFGFGDGVEPAGGPTDYTIHVAILSGSIAAAALLVYAGKGAARRMNASFWVIPAIALGYATPVLVGSLFVTLRFPDAGVVGIHPVAGEAFAFPALFALAAAGAGALSIATFEGTAARLRAWVATGARMFAAAIVLAFVGFIVLAGVRPEASGAYLRWISHNGNAGALVATHHLLLLPDQSLWIVAPSMGSCDSLTGSSSDATELCGRTLTLRNGWGEVVTGFFGLPQDEPMTLAAPFLLFLLVPTVGVVAGAARSSAGGSFAARIAGGAAAGLVFAALVFIGAVVSRVSIGDPVSGVLLSAGPEPTRTGLLALAWGIVGGAIGSAMFPMRPQVTVGASEAAPAPPSPTSV